MAFPSFQSGSLSLFLLVAAATLTLAVYSVTGGEHRNVSFLILFFGLYGTYRQYQSWRSMHS